mmetsp:Transcript_9745/g.36625  ORF Transcript_9745/g.36625 Transcript_9745/m.36625 type:complete len:282 (+) Transcript_9745:1480-2325(+)
MWTAPPSSPHGTKRRLYDCACPLDDDDDDVRLQDDVACGTPVLKSRSDTRVSHSRTRPPASTPGSFTNTTRKRLRSCRWDSRISCSMLSSSRRLREISIRAWPLSQGCRMSSSCLRNHACFLRKDMAATAARSVCPWSSVLALLALLMERSRCWPRRGAGGKVLRPWQQNPNMLSSNSLPERPSALARSMGASADVRLLAAPPASRVLLFLGRALARPRPPKSRSRKVGAGEDRRVEDLGDMSGKRKESQLEESGSSSSPASCSITPAVLMSLMLLWLRSR